MGNIGGSRDGGAGAVAAALVECDSEGLIDTPASSVMSEGMYEVPGNNLHISLLIWTKIQCQSKQIHFKIHVI